MSTNVGSNYTQKRRAGLVEVAGHVYNRQHDIIQFVMGNQTPIVFALDHEEKGHFMLIDASKLQPSHLGAVQNPYHFIPEAQPRNRATSASGALTPERIAKNLRPDEIMLGLSAYSGAPVVNAKGEVIQGNGRGYALKTYWQQFPNDPKGYRQALFDNNYKFGFLMLDDQLRKAGIKHPVLVRMLDVSDKEAIQLGQFTQADTEAVATSTTKIKSKARLLTAPVLKRILSELTRNDAEDDKSLAELIRESKVLSVLIKEQIIRADDLENYTRNGSINEAGVDFVSSLLLNALFRSQDVNTADVLVLLPVSTQNAIKKSTLHLLRCTGYKSLNHEVSQAILGYREFLSSGEASIRSWKNQFDLQGKTPADRYSPLELALIELFQKSTTQKEVVSKFHQYAMLVNARPGNMFESAQKGQTKRQAAKTVFNVIVQVNTAHTQKSRQASRSLGALRRGRSRNRHSNQSTAPALVVNSSTISTTMTDAEKEAFKKRMAEGRAKSAKKKPAAGKSGAKKKAAPKAKSKVKTKAKPKPKPKAKPKSTARKTAVRKRATVKKTATKARKSPAKKTTSRSRSKTVAVSSRKEQSGKNFIKQVDALADRIHEKSATGEFVKVPVYKISRSDAKKKAFTALSRTRKAKNVTNVRLKIK